MFNGQALPPNLMSLGNGVFFSRMAICKTCLEVPDSSIYSLSSISPRYIHIVVSLCLGNLGYACL